MCGAIRYSAEGKTPSRRSVSNAVSFANHDIPVGPAVGARAICHCADCQKVYKRPLESAHKATNTDIRCQRTSSAFSVNWIIPRKNFKFTKGKYRRNQDLDRLY
jgi:hypothetical protein